MEQNCTTDIFTGTFILKLSVGKWNIERDKCVMCPDKEMLCYLLEDYIEIDTTLVGMAEVCVSARTEN